MLMLIPSWWSRARIAAWVLVGAVAIVAPLALRVAWEGRAELELAEQARVDGDRELEIVHLGRAARWRLPLASHDERALDRLMEIGAEHETRGDDGIPLALAAFREVRHALLGTRAWGVPHEDRFHEVNRRIAELMAHQERIYGTDISGTGDPEAYHLDLLERVPGPHPVRGKLAAFAFIAWIVASVGFILRGLDARGQLRPRPALLWGGSSIVLMALWMVLLRHAG